MDSLYRFADRAGLALLRGLGVRTHWSGVEGLPATGPALLPITHVGYADFVFVQRAALTRGRHVRFMCRHDIWHGPVLTRAMDAMRHIPVDRQAPAHAYLRARSLLRDGEVVGGFPEAGISYSYTVRPLMRGFVALARESGVPLIPTAVWGSQRLYTVGDPEPPPDLTRRRRVDVAFGEPWYVDRGDDLTELTHELGRRMTTQLEALQTLPHHQPRPGEVATWHPAHLGGHALTRHQARALDSVPRSAVRPSWGPDLDAYDDLAGR